VARPYASEMAKVPQTFDWAAITDIDALRKAVRTAALSPLRAIGSGGSLTVAHLLASFHQHYTGRLAAVATPLEAVGEPLDTSVCHWLVSAGGGNVDILAAARTLIDREPRQLAVLCGREDSPLAEICRTHPFTDLLTFPPPAGKDGFLATNSLLGFGALLARTYATEFSEESHWVETAEIIRQSVKENSEISAIWEAETSLLWERPTTLVLHSSSTRAGAVDLESKFTEAALGNLQLADYRNFAHGRHHWLAKRGNMSAVLAFITEADRSLAERTLDLIPADVPQARLCLPGNTTTTALLSLLAALLVTGWAGFARGIDPGRPGVPDFGRKLYNLPLPRAPSRRKDVFSSRDGAAITRKSPRSRGRTRALANGA
jgi:fructoselysine-6-P-deglycase FrlB-like protein